MGSLSDFCLLYFSRFQKFRGFLFISSGKVNCIWALCFLHTLLYSWYACLVRLSCLPNALLCYLYVLRAFLQPSSNHGAKCFAHLLGFTFIVCCISLSTPASRASRIRNYSNYSVRWSLSSLYCVVILSNFCANLSLFVCSFHFHILRMYSLVSSLPIHS